MESSKADRMQNQINLMRSEMDQRLNAQQKLINTQVVLLKDYDIKINTLLDLCISNKLFSLGDYEICTDMRRGLRLMLPEEDLVNGDIVWVDYVARVETADGSLEEIASQKGLPIRLGSGAMIFESQLVGKHVGDKFKFVTEPQGAGPDKGKPVIMDIEIAKAKTKLLEVHDESTDGTDAESGLSAGDQGASELETAPLGSGHEQSNDSGAQPLQQ